jgi:hypothetical protein
MSQAAYLGSGWGLDISWNSGSLLCLPQFGILYPEHRTLVENAAKIS